MPRTFTPLFDHMVQRYGIVGAAVYGRIHRYAGRDRQCMASVATIAAELRCSPATVKRWAARLVADGHLTKDWSLGRTARYAVPGTYGPVPQGGSPTEIRESQATCSAADETDGNQALSELDQPSSERARSASGQAQKALGQPSSERARSGADPAHKEPSRPSSERARSRADPAHKELGPSSERATKIQGKRQEGMLTHPGDSKPVAARGEQTTAGGKPGRKARAKRKPDPWQPFKEAWRTSFGLPATTSTWKLAQKCVAVFRDQGVEPADAPGSWDSFVTWMRVEDRWKYVQAHSASAYLGRWFADGQSRLDETWHY